MIEGVYSLVWKQLPGSRRMARRKPAEWLNSRQGRFGMGLLGLFLAYALATRAIDTGSYWQYFGTFLLLVLGGKLIIRATKTHERQD